MTDDSPRLRVLRGETLKKDGGRDEKTFVNIRIPYATIPKEGEGLLDILHQKISDGELTEDEALRYIGLGGHIAERIMSMDDVPTSILTIGLESDNSEIFDAALVNFRVGDFPIDTKTFVKLFDKVINDYTQYNNDDGLSNAHSLLFRHDYRERLDEPDEVICNLIDDILHHREDLSSDDVNQILCVERSSTIPERCACEVVKRLVTNPIDGMRILRLDGNIDDECMCEINEMALIDVQYTKLPKGCACEVANKMAEGNRVNKVLLARMRLPKDCRHLYLTLSNDFDYVVRGELVENKYIPKDIRCALLVKASRDRTKFVKQMLFDMLKTKARDGKHDECAEKILNDMADRNLMNPQIADLVHTMKNDEGCKIVNELFKANSHLELLIGGGYAFGANEQIQGCVCNGLKRKLGKKTLKKSDRELLLDGLNIESVGARCYADIMKEEMANPAVNGVPRRLYSELVSHSMPEKEECEIVSTIIDRGIAGEGNEFVADVFEIFDTGKYHDTYIYNPKDSCRDAVFEKLETFLEMRDYPINYREKNNIINDLKSPFRKWKRRRGGQK